MEILRGVARDLSAAEVALTTSGIARTAGTQSTLLAIGRDRVRMMLTGPLRYDEGDEVIVAGKLMPDGTFGAFAGKNVTSGVTAYRGSKSSLAVSAIIFTIFAPFSIILIGLPFCIGAGAYFAVKARARLASILVEKQLQPAEPAPAAL